VAQALDARQAAVIGFDAFNMVSLVSVRISSPDWRATKPAGGTLKLDEYQTTMNAEAPRRAAARIW